MRPCLRTFATCLRPSLCTSVVSEGRISEFACIAHIALLQILCRLITMQFSNGKFTFLVYCVLPFQVFKVYI